MTWRCLAVERPKPIRPVVGTGAAGIKRTGSLDTIAVPYLTGQWPRGDYQLQHPTGPDYLDKTTQVRVSEVFSVSTGSTGR